MLELFEKFARRHQAWRRPLLLLLVITAAGFFALVATASSATLDLWLIPVVLLMLWLLQFYSGLSLFAVIPPRVDPAEPWLYRLKRRLVRFVYHLFAWFMMLVTLAWALTSLQLTMAWFRMG
jgi:hypothetical protein